MQRTIKIMGVGIGTEPVEIAVEVDGVALATRPIYMIADRTAEKNSRSVCSWSEDISFTGSRHLKITVVRGEFWYISALSNYMPLREKTAQDTVISSGATNFLPCYQQVEPEGVYLDPNANVTIDGFALTREVRDPSHKFKQWPWQLLPGTVFESDLMITAGTTENNIFDTDTVLDSVIYTADGIRTQFEGSLTNRPNRLAAYVNDVRQTIQVPRNQIPDPDDLIMPGFVEAVDSDPRVIQGYDNAMDPGYVRFAAPPENGSIIRIDTLLQMGSPVRYVGY